MSNTSPFNPQWQQIKEKFAATLPTAVVWCTYLIVAIGIVKVSGKLIDKNEPADTTNNATEVRVYFGDQDSIVPIIREELDSVKELLKSMRNDSITVIVRKTSSR